jgi:hypothetical protein
MAPGADHWNGVTLHLEVIVRAREMDWSKAMSTIQFSPDSVSGGTQDKAMEKITSQACKSMCALSALNYCACD